MLRIGITGGIGSGKSTVARIFQVLGVPVYNADSAAKRLMNEDPQLQQELIAHFGPETYQDGRLNRSWLASVVFNNKEKLELLNSLVHPATIRDGEAWTARQQSAYTIKEAALLFESGSYRHLDYVIGVSAPLALRIHRTMQRDQVSKEEVQSRMNKQIPENIKMRLCDFVIVNDEQQAVIPQVLTLHKQLLELSKATQSPVPA
ncbi:MAG: dephospho-CoA kinase [Candidatus Pseudobacter hemicellulosilyticus]|uniref:Dephospho-CoA kinase n=1 Tax=Candidatus Pseudobacter hemicellulosilyticus TaxID=3121375 RepID=A0AAJ6BFH3_9BACT|nr:MAG: dephospho-CoA kinase [Pseudobacter sp.]